jgi:hypothetical protein
LTQALKIFDPEYKSMEATKTYPHVYQFGPVFKTFVIVAAVALIAIGITGAMQSYTHMNSVGAQFGGILLSMVPIAVALFGAPMVWRCKLTLHEDRLEYNGLIVDAVIRKSDVLEALTPAPQYGMFQIFLTLAGHPFKRLHLAVLGHMDDALERWVNALPHGETSKA